MLRPLARAHRGLVAALLGVGALASLCEGMGISLFLPLLHSMDPAGFEEGTGGALGRVFHRVFEGVPEGARMQVVLGAMFALLAAKAGLNAASGLLFARLDARLVNELRQRVMDQALRVRLGFIERQRTGDMVALVQNQTWETSGALATLIGIVIRLATITVFGLALLSISWRMTLTVAAALLVISWIVRQIGRRVDRLSEDGLREWNTLSQRCIEVLRGQRTARAFGREDHERAAFAASSTSTSQAYWRVERIRALVNPTSELMVAALLAGVLLLSVSDPGKLPAVLTFMFILFRLQPQVQRLDTDRVNLAASAPAVRTVTGFLHEADKPYLPEGTRPFRGLEDSISLHDVSYRYDGQADKDSALRGVTARIPANRTTAIVGPSGSGKSTLTYLLMRFADPLEGTIHLDGIGLAEFELATWRAGIALVSQDAHVFHATVADNIRYGRPDASDAAVREAARKAHAHEFIESLPAGYDTPLGEEGIQLSGGQRQRIALARALIRDARILVLDEATNALDAIAENVIQDALAELAGHYTMIVIAHRLATIEQADHVLVLDRGILVQQGERGRLLAEEGLFSQLHELQPGRTP
ncbi:ABC transporter ATP-binding protein [Saltatorellus ferox]|uniref:ABC transporter ATP-binding protein n=1 Tax=Saltatorellus ferox TaxID=2528018 RepID=UPI003AF3DA75